MSFHGFHGSDGPSFFPAEAVLNIEDVAEVLECSVDTVRRIPKTELPARQGPGKRHLYLWSDVLAYLRARPVVGAQAASKPPPAPSWEPLSLDRRLRRLSERGQ